MAIIPEDIYREFVAEFGDAADQVATRALRAELTRHRISRAVADGRDPAATVADALSRDPEFIARTDEITALPQPAGSLEKRRQHWA